MRVQIADNKLKITTESKNFYFNLPKDADNNLNHETYSIKKHNELLAENIIRNEIRQLLYKYKHRNDIHENIKQ